MKILCKNLLVLSIISTLCACSMLNMGSDNAISLKSEWVLTGLDSPESVILSSDGSFLYVSNVNGEGSDVDGNGYISKVSLDGKLLEKKWATDLNAPKGLALDRGILYVSDIDHLVLIEANTGEILSRVKANDAGFLNDVVITDLGVLVSDSARSRIYQYKDGTISVWHQDDLLGGVNGLLVRDSELLITTMNSGSLLSQNLSTKELSVISTNMIDADGIAVLKDGSYLVSSWPGKLYHVTDTENKVLIDTEEEKIYLNDFLLLDNTLLIPNWQPGSLRAFSVK